MTVYLLNPETKRTIAELEVGEKVNIHNGRLWERLNIKGIWVSPAFMEANNAGQRIFPRDERLFAKAFLECYSHRLGKEGFIWIKKENGKWNEWNAASEERKS